MFLGTVVETLDYCSDKLSLVIAGYRFFSSWNVLLAHVINQSIERTGVPSVKGSQCKEIINLNKKRGIVIIGRTSQRTNMPR